ncbi:MAG: hypothetical protein COA94_06885 [Rickettsiales bacterium]|nr:MAG: hypothetical protein COA94_06885 [Rickettsiales bacterium]
MSSSRSTRVNAKHLLSGDFSRNEGDWVRTQTWLRVFKILLQEDNLNTISEIDSTELKSLVSTHGVLGDSDFKKGRQGRQEKTSAQDSFKQVITTLLTRSINEETINSAKVSEFLKLFEGTPLEEYVISSANTLFKAKCTEHARPYSRAFEALDLSESTGLFKMLSAFNPFFSFVDTSIIPRNLFKMWVTPKTPDYDTIMSILSNTQETTIQNLKGDQVETKSIATLVATLNDTTDTDELDFGSASETSESTESVVSSDLDTSFTVSERSTVDLEVKSHTPGTLSDESRIFSACTTGDIKTVSTMLNGGYDVNSHETYDRPPLLLAVSVSDPNLALVSLLIDKGADVTARSTDDKGVLEHIQEDSLDMHPGATKDIIAKIASKFLDMGRIGQFVDELPSYLIDAQLNLWINALPEKVTQAIKSIKYSLHQDKLTSLQEALPLATSEEVPIELPLAEDLSQVDLLSLSLHDLFRKFLQDNPSVLGLTAGELAGTFSEEHSTMGDSLDPHPAD